MGVWWSFAQRGSWDVGSTVRLYKAVRPYFAYPSNTSLCRDEQISWNTVYNLYKKMTKNFLWIFRGSLGEALMAYMGMGEDPMEGGEGSSHLISN